MFLNDILIYFLTFAGSIVILNYLYPKLKSNLDEMLYIRMVFDRVKETNKDMKKKIIKHMISYLLSLAIIIASMIYAFSIYSDTYFWAVNGRYVAIPLYISFSIIYIKYKKRKEEKSISS